MSLPLMLRSAEREAIVWRRIWRSGAFSTFVAPVLMLVALGIGLGELVDEDTADVGGLDYLAFIDHYHERIKCFHVKDAEFKPDGRTGVYGGYQSWQNRAGRFRSTGDGEVDFVGIFTELTKYGYDGWATIEWECCFKDSQQGAEEGAPFIVSHMIQPPAKAFDDFAGGDVDQAAVRKALGLE